MASVAEACGTWHSTVTHVYEIWCCKVCLVQVCTAGLVLCLIWVWEKQSRRAFLESRQAPRRTPMATSHALSAQID